MGSAGVAPSTAPGLRCAVAYSGGRDSTALLHATLAAAAPLGIGVVALHVHHGLSPHADAWQAHCEAQCRRWNASGERLAPCSFDAVRLVARPPAGDSIEAWARRERAAALAAMAQRHRVDLLLVAHHRRDQAETWLLQALRGGGTRGLAAMPRTALRDGVQWVRPWLDVPRERIEDYARAHRLTWVDDDSNADPRFARNRLRAQVWPALATAFPQAEVVLATAAVHAQEALVCLEALASIDLAAAARDGHLIIDAWRQLPAARGSNALRVWLAAACTTPAPASLIARLQNELPTRSGLAAQGSWPIGKQWLRCHAGLLVVDATRPSVVPREPVATLSIRRAGRYRPRGWGGTLHVERVEERGVALDRLAALTLRPRLGGERFQAGPGRPARSLKKQFQAFGIAAWQRTAPLFYVADVLVYVPGLGIDARAVAGAGVAQVRLHWEPDHGG